MAQTTADMENFVMEPDTFLNGADGNGGFYSGNVFLPNDYNEDWDAFTGWAISNTSDVTMPGFMNQYSAITGSGYEGSSNYALAFIFGSTTLSLENDAAGEIVNGFYITNGTYPYLSMRDGDGFAKKFGGATGDAPDYFLLTIKKYLNGTLSTDSVDFYLADYRFADNAQDYIVDEWTYVDLTSLGAADSLYFELYSTDVGQNGINTPTYFFVDNIITSDGITSLKEIPAAEAFKVFPNPAHDKLQIESFLNNSSDIQIFNLSGQLIMSESINNNRHNLNISNLLPGAYVIKMINSKYFSSQLFIKN